MVITEHDVQLACQPPRRLCVELFELLDGQKSLPNPGDPLTGHTPAAPHPVDTQEQGNV
ncbi:hypothetical protein [Streptomyces sp. NPDC048349]|uniref:hypothetical protein n=1 Tax=Streptomyces sp. NPDC048349 TaxID=3155486 RepID=UPI003440F5AB